MSLKKAGRLPKPFVGMFGLRAKGGINKPSYYGYELLHQLGYRRIANAATDVIVTKTAQGGLAIAVWNLVDPGTQGAARTVELHFMHLPAQAQVSIERVDSDHGNVLPKYAAMGSPIDPTPDQVKELNEETALPAPEAAQLSDGALRLTLTPDALVLVEIRSRAEAQTPQAALSARHD